MDFLVVVYQKAKMAKCVAYKVDSNGWTTTDFEIIFFSLTKGEKHPVGNASTFLILRLCLDVL